MPTYEFVCQNSHVTARLASINDIPVSVDCGDCGEPTRRIYSAPYLGHSDRARVTALDRAAKSAHEPEIVRGTHPGTTATARTTQNPLHQRLPRD